MNISPDDTSGPKRRKLNENSKFKNEVLNILQKVIELESNQWNCETDGLTKSVKNSSSKQNTATVRASTIRLPQRSVCAKNLCSVFENWRSESKLVYALRGQYSESGLLFSNLKAADRTVGNFFLDIAESSDLKVLLGVFHKTSSLRYDTFDSDSYQHDVDGTTFEADGDALDVCHSYTLKSLVTSDGDQLLTSSLINVDVEAEVIPDDIFDEVDPYRKTVEPTGNNCIKICKFYRCTAITVWPLRYFLQILKKFGASSVDIDKIFIKESERPEINENVKEILLTWAEQILSNNYTKSVHMIKAIVRLGDLAIIRKLFSRCILLNEASIAIVESTCEKLGWKTFAEEILTMFGKVTKRVAVKLLTKLVIGPERSETEKQSIFRDVFEMILRKWNDESMSHSAWYSALSDKTKQREEEQDLLLSILKLSQNLSYDMLAFAKAQPLVVFVPALLQLAPNTSTKLDFHWHSVCKYFIHVMEAEVDKSLAVTDWKRHDSVPCPCSDCLQLNAFLQRDMESIKMKIGKGRRRHLHEQLNLLQNIVHETDRSGLYENLVITKATKEGSDDGEKQEISNKCLDSLRYIAPM